VEETTPKQEVEQKDLVSPYCGGCGHRFYYEPKLTQREAAERAKTRRCHYCIEDEESERQDRG
jgi:hypothetical protein